MQIYNIKVDENKRETTNHGIYEFPIQIYENVLEKNVLGFVNWHWHGELQLVKFPMKMDFALLVIIVKYLKTR